MKNGIICGDQTYSFFVRELPFLPKPIPRCREQLQETISLKHASFLQ